MADQSDGSFTRRIQPALPVDQMGFPVTSREWKRIQDKVRAIHGDENKWLSAMWFFAGATLTFVVGLWALSRAPDVSFPVMVFFWVGTSVFAAVTGVTFLGYQSGQGRRTGDIEDCVEYMNDIEALYQPSDARAQIASVPEQQGGKGEGEQREE